jgi:hypothetical protein
VLQQATEIPEDNVLNISTRQPGKQLAGLHQVRALGIQSRWPQRAASPRTSSATGATVVARGSSLTVMTTG